MQRALQRVSIASVYLRNRIPLFLVCMLVWVGCDAEPGVLDPTGRPPTVSNLTFTPDDLDVKSLDAVQDGMVDVQVDVSVQVLDTDSEVDRVVFVIRAPSQDQDAVAFNTLSEASTNLYTGSFTVTFDTGLIGNYPVEVYAVDEDNLLSNRALGTLTIRSDGQPPIISEVIGPDTIQRPATGSRQEQLVAVVSDPDGLSNIANVLFWNVNSPNNTFSLFDDGSQGGDEVAGDGRYTVTIVINSSNATGTNTFAFQATDRSGLQSDIITKDITVE